MALIPNASSLGDKVKNELYGIATYSKGNPVSAIYKAGKDVYKGATTKGGILGDKSGEGSTGDVQQASNNNDNNGNTPPPTPTPPPTSKSGGNSSLSSKAAAIKTSNASKSAQKQIGKSWDNMKGYMDDVRSDVNSLGDPSSMLGQARDSMLGAYERQHNKTTEAIKGNKDLITRNQTNDLKSLGDKLRKSIFDANVRFGGNDSSASGAMAKSITDTAGKNRQSILTGYGDQVSQENQNQENADDEYTLNRQKAYDWEKTNKEQALAKYEANVKMLDRLMDMVPDWKKADLKAEKEDHLASLKAELGNISQTAMNYRDYIYSKKAEADASTQAIDEAAIGIDAPAALDTPQFSDSLTASTDGNPDTQESFYNPNVKVKKKYTGDFGSNPLSFDEAFAAA